MVSVLRQALAVCALGVTFGLTIGAVRGFPEPAPRATESALTCLPPDPQRPTIQWISQVDAHQLSQDPHVMFVDARPHEVFEHGHVTAALHVPVAAGPPNESIVAMLRGARLVIAYDDTSEGCARATQLATQLAAAGLRDVRILEGGMPAWLQHGYPAEAGTCRLCP